MLDRIDATCLELLTFPELGPARDDIRPGFRYRVVGNYLVPYRIVGDGIVILRVLQGSRDRLNLA